MLIYFEKKILTVLYSRVKNLMLQFRHGNDVRFQQAQVNNRFCMYEIFVHYFFFANISIFLIEKNICTPIFTFSPTVKNLIDRIYSKVFSHEYFQMTGCKMTTF